MKNKLQLLLFGLMLCSLSYGQSDLSKTSHNNVYLELLGNGGLYSLNYERMVAENFALRLGFASFRSETLFGEGKKSILTVPVLGNLLFGEKKSKFEVGAGFLIGRQKFTSSHGSNSNTRSTIIDLTGVLGYRYQPSTRGLMFRVGVTPFYALNQGNDPYPSSGLFLSAGVSLGYSF